MSEEDWGITGERRSCISARIMLPDRGLVNVDLLSFY